MLLLLLLHTVMDIKQNKSFFLLGFFFFMVNKVIEISPHYC